MQRMKIKNFFKKEKKNSIAILILVLSVLSASVITFDLFNFRIENNEQRLTSSEIEGYATTIFETCTHQDGTNRQDCYGNTLKKITSSYGLTSAEQVLFALQDKDPFAQSCHVIAHRMSNAAYKIDPRDFTHIVDTVDITSCGGGFLHGILGAYADDHPNLTIDGAFGEAICDHGDPYRINSCMHFIGHMFILDTLGNLEQALPRCEGIREALRFNCYDGIFMEDHQKLMLSEHGIVPLPVLDKNYFNIIEKKCLNSSGIMAQACWTEMAEMYAHGYRYDPTIIYNNCSKAQTSDFAKSCYLKGVNAMAIYPGFDTKPKLLSLCAPYINNSSSYNHCSYILISALLFNSPKFTSRAITYCEANKSEYADYCYNTISERLRVAVKDSSIRNQYCAMLPTSYSKKCAL